jgi:cytochrome c-type biogenesis protein CcmI
VFAVAMLVLRLRAPAPADDPTDARRAQLRASLAELARARDEGVLDAANFDDERRRIDGDLAALPGTRETAASANPPRTVWPFALVVLVLLPVIAVGLYVSLQGPFWQALDSAPAVGAAAPVGSAVPPPGSAAPVGTASAAGVESAGVELVAGGSADATQSGIVTAAPTPRNTARAPTRPIYREHFIEVPFARAGPRDHAGGKLTSG